MTYKQNVEIAEEEVINNVLSFNKYDEIKKRVAYDLTTIGIGANKTRFNKAEGIITEYVDPANMVYSYTEDPNFEDIYYVGEVKSISLPEPKKEYSEDNQRQINKALTNIIEQLNSTYLTQQKEDQERFTWLGLG